MSHSSTPCANFQGQTLADGRFRIVSRVGSGGMADVYRAMDHQTNRDVAVKIPKPHVSDDVEFAKRFHREIKTMAGLNHPHIMPVLHAGEHNGNVFAVFPFLSGGSLKQRITGADGLGTSLKNAVQVPNCACQPVVRSWLIACCANSTTFAGEPTA